MAAKEAELYHAEQIGWRADTQVDMITALTYTQSGEAVGVVLAAQKVGLPAVVSFTVETDGRLPTGEPLRDAIRSVDDATAGGAAYFMVNCAHPDHFFGELTDTLFRQISDISVLNGALSCLVDNRRRQKSYLKQYVKFHLLSYEPGGRTFESCQARQNSL